MNHGVFKVRRRLGSGRPTFPGRSPRLSVAPSVPSRPPSGPPRRYLPSDHNDHPSDVLVSIKVSTGVCLSGSTHAWVESTKELKFFVSPCVPILRDFKEKKA
jgi:hypothetical protein